MDDQLTIIKSASESAAAIRRADRAKIEEENPGRLERRNAQLARVAQARAELESLTKRYTPFLHEAQKITYSDFLRVRSHHLGEQYQRAVTDLTRLIGGTEEFSMKDVEQQLKQLTSDRVDFEGELKSLTKHHIDGMFEHTRTIEGLVSGLAELAAQYNERAEATAGAVVRFLPPLPEEPISETKVRSTFNVFEV